MKTTLSFVGLAATLLFAFALPAFAAGPGDHSSSTNPSVGPQRPQTTPENATATFYYWDHLGTTRMAAPEVPTAANVERHDYEPYGLEMLPATNQAGNIHQFTGHERDLDTGLDNMHARYYGSNIGRFMKPDNGVDQDPQNPQSWNLYSYVRGNPVNFNDPTGHVTDVTLENKAVAAEKTSAEMSPKAQGILVAAVVFLVTENPILAAAAGKSVEAAANQVSGNQQAANENVLDAGLILAGGLGKPEAGATPKFAPKGEGGKPLELPKGPGGAPVPSSMSPHTQIGTKEGSKGPYIQTRTWGENGQQGPRTDWTDHGRRDTHSNPHDHPVIPNPSGGTPKVGPQEPHKTWPE